jgi:1-acyl-sn-glycerol-3-phosphate acyltransferase
VLGEIVTKVRARFERRPRPRPRPWTEEQSEFWYRLFEVVFWPIFHLWIRYFRVLGIENVPAAGSQFVLCNHTTGMDPFILGYAIKHRRINGPGKVELFTHPVFSFLMRKIGIFPIHQGVADAAAVRTMISLYRAGRMIVIFPEGGRSETGELKEFVPGLARLMIRLKAPIVPAAIAGGSDLLPIHHRIPRRNTPVVVSFGRQFELSDFYGRELTPEAVEEATDVVRRHIEDQLAVARAERERLLARLRR